MGMLNDRIKEQRLKSGLTLLDVAERLGVKEATVQRYESGEIKNIKHETVVELSKIFHCDPAYLMGWKDSLVPPMSNSIPYSTGVPIRVVGAVRCGYGALAFEDDIGVEYADVNDPSEFIWLKVQGDSMEPRICDGDFALIHLQRDLNSGEIGAVIVDGEEGTLKKIIKQDNALVLQAFNPIYPPKIITGEKLNEIYIVGKLIETKRKW